MYLDNTVYYGHLVDPDNYQTTHLHNDMYEIINNPYVSFFLLVILGNISFEFFFIQIL